MKKILLLYFGGLLFCLLLGTVVSSAVYHSLWFLILVIVPISFGWLLMTDVFFDVNGDNLKDYAVVTSLSFVVMIGLLMCVYYFCNVRSFFGLACIVGILSYISGLFIIGVGLQQRLKNKRIRERKMW
jgi:hypothetical protein